jgi:DNA replication protein DnaC
VRFTTAAELVTEMIEAQSQLQLTRVRNRWMRYELVVVDELGYVVMPDAAAELLFQVIAGRAEQAAIIVTTNLLCGAPHKRFNWVSARLMCPQYVVSPYGRTISARSIRTRSNVLNRGRLPRISRAPSLAGRFYLPAVREII